MRRRGYSRASRPARLVCGELAPVPTAVLSPTISRRSAGLAGLCCSGSLRRARSPAWPMRHTVQPDTVSSASTTRPASSRVQGQEEGVVMGRKLT